MGSDGGRYGRWGQIGADHYDPPQTMNSFNIASMALRGKAQLLGQVGSPKTSFGPLQNITLDFAVVPGVRQRIT